MGNERNTLLSMQFFAVLCISIALVQMRVYAAIVTVGPTLGMCIGVDEAATTLAEKSAMYLALCDGDFSVARTGATSYDESIGYLKMAVEKIAFVRDGYLKETQSLCPSNTPTTCSAADNVYLMSGSSGDKIFQRTASSATASDADGGGTYAYSSTGAYFAKSTADANTGLPAGGASGFYAGTASYMVTAGSITVNFNEFDIAGKKKSACISAIDGKATPVECGAKRTFTEGTYKFSLFGYTSSTSDTIKNVVAKSNGGTAKPFQYIGFRQVITLNAAPSAATVSVLVTKVSGGAGVDPDQAWEEDIASFQLCVNTTKCLQYSFPSKYNTGDLGTDGKPVIDANAATKDIKIKVSWNGAKTAMSLNVDYLMAAADVQADKRWFVYDPDVFDPALSGVSTTTGVGYVALSVCAIAMSIVRLNE